MKSGKTSQEILLGDCLAFLKEGKIKGLDLTFFDPPYNQGKDYDYFDDNQNPEEYWEWIKEIVQEIFEATSLNGSIYLMHREKNTEHLLRVLREAGWNFQNLIIWQKMTSAVPSKIRYGKQYQVIAYAIKGKKPRVFNKLRIDPPLPSNYKYKRENGMFVTDIWSDIRELTSGYFAGDEAIRDQDGTRIHKQQTPIALLLRIILTSSLPTDTVFDPMAGTGTTLVTAMQLNRNAIGIEIDPKYVEIVKDRLKTLKPSDDVHQFLNYYEFTPNLEKIAGFPIDFAQ